MALAIALVGGFLIGALIGRWWVLVGALVLGAWIATTTEVDEVAPAILGLGYSAICALGLASGVLSRRHVSRPGR
jgi:hypothetical protein